MKLPKAATAAVEVFESLLPGAPNVSSKKLFGQPAAFVNGNLFFGVFGTQIFVRLSPKDRSDALQRPEFSTFEPMPGRPMKEYVVLPNSVLRDRAESRAWVNTALTYATGLPRKK